MKKRILYNFWGYLSNRYEISAPDGNASYSPWIINSFIDHGYDVFAGPIDRDKPIIDKYGLEKSFSTFMTEDRIKAYTNLQFVDLENLPEIDILLLEWRFPTAYNTIEEENWSFCPDLKIQNKLLDHYYGKVKIVVLDLDLNFSLSDKIKYPDIRRISQEDISLGAPIESLLPEMSIDTAKIFSFVGNEYKKMIDISRKIDYVSNKYKGLVHFYGNWTREDKKPFRDAYPNIVYHGRIGIGEFSEAMSDSLVVPILGTEAYRKRGFMTYRIAESLMFGSIPLGFSDFKNIREFLPEELIVDMNEYEIDIERKISYLLNQTYEQRVELRDKVAKMLAKKFSIDNFYNEVTK